MGRGFIRGLQGLQVGFDTGPFVAGDAVHHSITDKTVGQNHVGAKRSFSCGTYAFNRALRRDISGIGFELDTVKLEGFKTVREQKPFRFGVDSGSLVRFAKPRSPDFRSFMFAGDVH